MNATNNPQCPNNGTSNIDSEVRTFMKQHYDLRFNLLTEETEFRPQGECDIAFAPCGKREVNTFCIEAREAGINCWDRDVMRYLYSCYVTPYHPFHLYMEELPVWDGRERVDFLAKRVSKLPHWVKGFHTWMLALAAQWMGLPGKHANSVAPILVSREQGRRKSTFCRSLMPPVLSRYYMDNLKLNSQGQAERMLAEMGLLNLDEFDKYGGNQMALLKNLMQMNSLLVRRAYQGNFKQLPRVASFIGTSNSHDLLTDPTGSRRQLCVEVERPIACDHINHAQIFAQLKAELLAGRRCWFTKQEEAVIQRHNELFYRTSTVEDAFFTLFRAPAPGESPKQLTAAELLRRTMESNPVALRGYSPTNFGRVLQKAGLKRIHTALGNVYEVMEREEGSAKNGFSAFSGTN